LTVSAYLILYIDSHSALIALFIIMVSLLSKYSLYCYCFILFIYSSYFDAGLSNYFTLQALNKHHSPQDLS
jgi:hypothetical protein